jgi:hypothetical protein
MRMHGGDAFDQRRPEATSAGLYSTAPSARLRVASPVTMDTLK